MSLDNSSEIVTLFDEEILDEKVSNKMIQELKHLDVSRSPDFDKELPFLVGELRDRGVTIGNFEGNSRRIVFNGFYKGKDVALKFSHALKTPDHDERQQQQEEVIWDRVNKTADEKYFAEVYFSSPGSQYIVQELCDDVHNVEYADLKEPYKDLADKYWIREIELGFTKKGKLVFVDYGH